MNLDPVASVFCGVMALCLFALHIVSSPRRHHWMTMPEYVRRGLFVSGAMFMWRSVNFIMQPPAEVSSVGHINAEGMLALMALTYTSGALTIWAVRRVLPGKGWDRLHWVEQKERESPSNIPVVLTAAEVAELAEKKGFHVNAGLPEKPR